MLDYRLYEPKDFGRCLDLIREGHDPEFSEERFRWLHEQGPAGPSQIAVCQRGDQIVGMYSCLPKAIRFNGTDYCGGRDVDPVVHPSCRGQGVFSQLLVFGKTHFKGLDFFFNFANPGSAVGFRRQGWRDVMALEDRVCQLGYSRPLSREGILYGISRILRPNTGDVQTRALSPDAFKEMIQHDLLVTAPEASPPYGGVCRTTDYLTWRYLCHPIYQYSYFVAENEAGPAGFVICRFEEKTERLTVVDLVETGLTVALASWIPLWENQFPSATVVAWHSLPKHALAGFIGNPSRRGQGQTFLACKSHDGKMPPRLFDGSNWFLTRGDLEIA